MEKDQTDMNIKCLHVIVEKLASYILDLESRILELEFRSCQRDIYGNSDHKYYTTSGDKILWSSGDEALRKR